MQTKYPAKLRPEVTQIGRNLLLINHKLTDANTHTQRQCDDVINVCERDGVKIVVGVHQRLLPFWCHRDIKLSKVSVDANPKIDQLQKMYRFQIAGTRQRCCHNHSKTCFNSKHY